ncbi:MAG: hypothetical protein AAB470_02135 [Patescibacteria group bacterium]
MTTATKNLRPKNKKNLVSARLNNNKTDGGVDVIPTLIKKSLPVDDLDPVITLEEKPEEDPLIGAIEEDENLEEISLDREELNPFGDRWEE